MNPILKSHSSNNLQWKNAYHSLKINSQVGRIHPKVCDQLFGCHLHASMDYTILNVQSGSTDDIHKLIDFLMTTGSPSPMGFEPEFRTWLSVDPNGIFVAVLNSDRKIIGSICGMAVSETQGYVGLQVVREDWNGGDLSAALWAKAALHLGDRNVGFCLPEPAFSANRNLHGVKHFPDWKILQFIRSRPLSRPSHPNFLSHVVAGAKPVSVLLGTNESLKQKILDYDASLHNYDCSFLASSMLSEFGCVTRVLMREEHVVGYLCMKSVSTGHWGIGPMYADDYEAAYTLLYDMLSNTMERAARRGFLLSLPSSNTQGLRLMDTLGFQRHGSEHHVGYTKFVPDIPISKIYSIHSEIFCIE